MTLTQPLDLQTHFITVLAGSPEIFSFVAMLVVAYGCAYFNLSNKMSLVMFAAFILIMATYLQGLYILLILIGGLVTFYSLRKLIN